MITLLLLAALPQAPNSQARLHPAQTVIYVEMPDVGTLLDAYREAPTVQMVRSEAVVTAVSELLDTVEYDLDGLIGKVAEQVGVPVEMIHSPGETLATALRQVSGASLSLSLLETDAGEFESTIGRVAACMRDLTALTDELYLFAAEHDELFPSALADLGTDTAIVDPWGQPYTYVVDADGTGFELAALGADGQPGGDGAATDFDLTTELDSVVEDELLRRVGSTAVVEFTKAEVAAASYDFVRGMAQKMGLQSTTGSYQLADDSNAVLAWFRIPNLPDTPLWTMRSGSRLAIGFGSSDPESFLQRLSGEGASTATAVPYREMRERLGPSGGASVMQGFVALSDIAQAAAELDDSSSNLDFIAPYLSSSWRMALDGDRFVTEVQGAAPGPDNQLAQCLGCKPVPAGLWDYIPPESIAVYATSIDGPILYRMLLAAMGSDSDSEHVPEMVRELEERHDFNVENDLFAALGSGAGFYMLPIGGLMSMPGMVIVLELDDAASFQKGLEGLLAALQEEGGSEFEIKYRPYRDAPLWYFSFNTGSPIPISPALAIIDDHLLITLTSVRAKKEIKRILAGPGERHPLLASTNAPPDDAVGVGYMDWGTLFEGVYEGGRAALAFMGGGMELPFDITTLPEGSTFSEFYRPTVSWSQKNEHGFYSRTESSFGPETLLGLAALGGGAFVGFKAFSEGELEVVDESGGLDETTAEGQEPEPPSLPAETTTAETMRGLSTRLAVYKLELGRYPEELSKLLGPTENYPNGFLDGGEVPVDGWGRVFSYEVSTDTTTYQLWSKGVDGIDQGGQGDDLVEG
jgi:hypothetical protein